MAEPTAPTKEQVQRLRAQSDALLQQAEAMERQVEAQEKLNESTENQLSMSERILESLGERLDKLDKIDTSSEGLKKNMLSMVDSLKKNKSFNSFLESLKNGFNEIKKTGIFKFISTGLKAISPLLKILGKGFQIFSKIAVAALDLVMKHPVVAAISLAIKAAQKLAEVMSTVFLGGIKYATRFVKFMVSLPLKIAGAAAKIGNSLRQDLVMTIGTAVEATKEMFDISEQYGSGAGSAIKSFADSASASMLEFRDITSESVKLFGEGAAGIAARTQAMAQRLGEMGSYADRLGESLRASTDGSAVQFTFMEKSLRILGMTAEDVAYTAQEAVKSGVGINKILMDTQISLKNVAKSSGVNSKLISKNFNVLRKDIINFGHMSTEQLQQTSAELVKMGLSAQDAAQMFSKLDTFESAAQMSAMLSQSFGMNLDALKLIKAEKPEEIFEDLRDAMMSTGRSFDDMNRHERSLMASTTGMSETALKAMMDFRDMGMSYEESMQKMKENSPEEKQLKAFNEMTGSLKEIKNIMQDTSFFSSFFKGLRSSIVLASGLGDKFQLVSKRIEEFYTEGLSFGKDPAFMKSITGAFKPISDTLESLVGDPSKGTKGLFDTAKLSKVVKPWMKKFSDTLGDAFSGKKSLASVRDGFTNMLRTSFSFNTFLRSKNNPAAELFRTGGKLVGQLIKGFAAIGPGLVDMFATGFQHVADFLRNTGGKNNSIKNMLTTLFGFTDKESEAIYGSYEQMLTTIFTKVVPVIKDLFLFVNSKIAGAAFDLGVELIGKIFKGMLHGIGSMIGYVYDFFIEMLPYPLQKALSFLDFGTGLLTTEDAKVRAAAEKSAAARNISSSEIDSEFYNQIVSGDDRTQERRIGELLAVLEKEKKGATGTQLNALNEIVGELRSMGTNFDGMFGLASDQAEIDKALKLLGKNTVVIEGRKANDFLSNSVAGSGQSIVQKTSSGISVTNLNEKDQILAGMEGGPIVDAIRYSGAAVGSIVDFFSNQFSALGGLLGVTADSGRAQQGSNQPIELVINLDGEKVASKLVAADIIGMAKNPAIARGATVLNDGSTRNQSGGSNEISALG